MTTNLARKEVYTFADLEQIPRDLGQRITPYFQNMDLNRYKRFLHMMYHYTIGSGAKALKSAESSKFLDQKNFFLHMAKEEKGHYVLAREDLKAFGELINESESTPLVVKKCNEWWESNYDNTVKQLASLFVFENIGQYIVEDVISSMKKLNLTKKQSRWVNVHAEADDQHGKDAAILTRKYFENYSDIMISAATEAAEHWFNINKAALE